MPNTKYRQQPNALPLTPDRAEKALSTALTDIGDLIHSKTLKDTPAKASISQTLRQLWSNHTARMAAAVLIQAFAVSDHQPSLIDKHCVIQTWRRSQAKSKDPDPHRILPMAIAITAQIHRGINNILRQASDASAIVRQQLAQGHDVTGQSLQHTVLDRRDLASYHTLPAAASFLAQLAIPDAQQLSRTAGPRKSIRIIDPTCGAGALLRAAAETFRHRITDQPADGHQPAHDLRLTLSGFDILPANTALTAVNLRQHTSAQQNIITLQYGPDSNDKQADASQSPRQGPRPVRLGSLELLDPGSPQSAELRQRDKYLRHHGQHFVIMNPPFTKCPSQQATDRNPSEDSHATTPEELHSMEQRAAQLANLANCNPSKGLALIYANLAQDLVAPGGTIALLLPLTAVSSSPERHPAGWQLFRQNIARDFRDITVVSLAGHNKQQTSFSTDTGIAEVIIVAGKLQKGEKAPGTARFINLTAPPLDDEEASRFAHAIREQKPSPPIQPTVPESQPLTIDGRAIGTLINTNLPSTGPWPMAGAADPRIVQTAVNLRSGKLTKAGTQHSVRIPITTLSNLGTRSSVQSYKSREFLITPGTPAPPALPFLDSRNPSRQKFVLLRPSHSALPQSAAAAVKAAQQAAVLHINNNHRYNSQPLAAAAATDPCLAGPGWSTIRMEDNLFEKATALWFNTTIGLLSQWAAANHTQTGLGYLTKSLTPELTTLDLRQFSKSQIAKIAKTFSDIAGATLMPASCAWQDPVRIELDRRIFEDVLRIRDDKTRDLITWLRYAWCSEPSVQGTKASRKVHQESMAVLAQNLRDSDNNLGTAPRQDPTPGDPGQEHPEDLRQPGISPQMLRDIADALEKAEQSPSYRELRLSTEHNRLLLTATAHNGQQFTKISRLDDPDPLHINPVLVLEQT